MSRDRLQHMAQNAEVLWFRNCFNWQAGNGDRRSRARGIFAWKDFSRTTRRFPMNRRPVQHSTEF